jgi:thiamine-monophosphate kinase
MRPQPRIDAGHASVTAGVRCGIDISDGLVRDLGHICDASGVGAEVELERVPIDAALIDAYPGDAAMMAATGGEDYELVLIGDEAAIERASRALGGSLTVIGRVVEGARVRVLDAHGGDVTFGATGWDHLASKDSR